MTSLVSDNHNSATKARRSLPNGTGKVSIRRQQITSSTNSKVGTQVEDVTKKLQSVTDTIALSSVDVTNAKKDVAQNRKSIVDLSSSLQDLMKQVQGLTENDAFKQIIATLQEQIQKLLGQIQALGKEVRQLKAVSNHGQIKRVVLSEIDTHMKTSAAADGVLKVGKPFNIGQQPVPKKEGGMHKIAPLAMAVNGGILAHDIGYTTTKKGTHPLVVDKDGRVLVYHGTNKL